jgi:PAS domain S-box-containing protein
MNTSSNKSHDLYFLSGGGQMGDLTRKFDWSRTPVGAPDNWPQNLRLTLSMILSSRFPMFLWWGEDLIQFYNDAYRPSLGNNGKHPRALGQKGADCWPEIWPIIFPLIQQVRETAQATWSEDQLVPIFRNGHIEDVYWTFGYSPILSDIQTVEGVLVVCTETTEKVQSLKALEKSEENMRNMVLQAPVAMCILMGAEHVIEIANEHMITLWGKTKTEVMNRPVFEALPDAREQGLESLLSHVYLTGETFKANERPVSLIRNGQREVVYQNFVYEPYKASDGTILGVLATSVDVTDQVTARQITEKNEAELLDIKIRLERELQAGRQLQQQKDDFIGIASHELKTPLTALKSAMQLLNRWAAEDGCSHKVLNLISVSNTNILKLNHLLEELLNDTKINEGQLQLSKTRFVMADLINECCGQVTAAGDYDIIEEGELDLEVRADRHRIEQVVQNFVNNAVKYAPQSKEVIITIQRLGDHMKVSVTDHGPGISPDKLPHLFKRYYRVDTSGIQYSGLGLGLFISSEIIQRHNGQIGVESELGKGSTFWFTIPLNEQVIAENKTAISSLSE